MKRLSLLFLSAILILTPICATALSLQSFIAALTNDELIELIDILEAELIDRGLLTPSEPKKSVAEPLVWIPRSGSKYHKKSTCSNMKNPNQIAKSEAIRLGYEPCKKCKP